jgi:hypothetical protein
VSPVAETRSTLAWLSPALVVGGDDDAVTGMVATGYGGVTGGKLMRLSFAVMTTLLAMTGLVRSAIAEDVRPPPGLDPFADAKQCSEAALTSYALSSAEPAEKIAEMAFRKCSDKWSRAVEPVGEQMDASPALKDAQENCIKRLGPSSCPAPLPSSVYLMNAAQRTFQYEAETKVFDIRAKAAEK